LTKSNYNLPSGDRHVQCRFPFLHLLRGKKAFLFMIFPTNSSTKGCRNLLASSACFLLLFSIYGVHFAGGCIFIRRLDHGYKKAPNYGGKEMREFYLARHKNQTAV
jgi:hypothetical protein